MRETDELDVTDLVAYLDESRKPLRNPRDGAVLESGEHYAVAAAILMDGDVAGFRNELAAISLQFTGGKPIRWKDLSTSKRPQVVAALVAIDDWEACIYETDKPFYGWRRDDAHVRGSVLTLAFTHLSENLEVARAVLETRSQPLRGFTTHDERDHRLLASLLDKKKVDRRFRIEHRGKEEPILWLADVLAGARTDYLCWADRSAYPMLGHRVMEIKSV